MLGGRDQPGSTVSADIYEFPASDESKPLATRMASRRRMKQHQVHSQSSSVATSAGNSRSSTPANALSHARPTSPYATRSGSNSQRTSQSSNHPTVTNILTGFHDKTPSKRVESSLAPKNSLNDDLSSDEDQTLQPIKRTPAPVNTPSTRKSSMSTQSSQNNSDGSTTPAARLTRRTAAKVNDHARTIVNDDKSHGDDVAVLEPAGKKQRLSPQCRSIQAKSFCSATENPAFATMPTTGNDGDSTRFSEGVISKAKAVVLDRLSGARPPHRLVGLAAQFE